MNLILFKPAAGYFNLLLKTLSLFVISYLAHESIDLSTLKKNKSKTQLNIISIIIKSNNNNQLHLTEVLQKSVINNNNYYVST